MELKTLRTQTVDALQRSLLEAEAEARSLRSKLGINQLKDVRSFRALRLNITRLKTVLREKQA